MNILKVYNSSSINHNKVLSKKSFFIIKQAMRMQNKNVVINNFNLYYFF